MLRSLSASGLCMLCGKALTLRANPVEECRV
jgi:hypothetical protein